MTRSTARQAGFTLLEILVVLVVLGFLMLGLAEGTRFGLRAWDTETAMTTRRADMDAMERVLRTTIAAADPGDVSEQVPFKGRRHTLSFVGRLPMSAGGAMVTRQADIALSVDGAQRLVLRWSPHPHAERLTKARATNSLVIVPPTRVLLFLKRHPTMQWRLGQRLEALTSPSPKARHRPPPPRRS